MSLSQPGLGRIDTRSESRSVEISRRCGQAFVWTSDFNLSAANQALLYLKNDDPERRLFIEQIYCSSQNIGTFSVFEVTGTPGGAPTINGVNQNLGSEVTASATSHGDAPVTGLTQEGRLAVGRQRREVIPFRYGGTLILPKDKAIAVFCSAGGGRADSMIRGYFE